MNIHKYIDNVVKETLQKSIPQKLLVCGTNRYATLINESSINRILNHGKSGMIIISASRDAIESDDPNCDLSSDYQQFIEQNNIEDNEKIRTQWLNNRNKNAERELLKQIKQSGYSFSKVYGGYHDKEELASGEVKDINSYEPSFIVYSYDRNGKQIDFDELVQDALHWTAMFKQQSVYVQAPNQAPVYLDKDGNKVNSSSSLNFKQNRDDEMFYTTNKRKKNNPQRFTADIQFENFMIPIKPGSLNERRMRMSIGEIIL